MSSEVVSSVDMNASLTNTSMGINGLLNFEDVKKVYREYHLDMKRDQLLKRSQEKGQMSYIYKNFKQMDFQLSEAGDGRTKLSYRLTYKRIGALDILLLVYVLVCLGLAGFLYSVLWQKGSDAAGYMVLYASFGVAIALFLGIFFLDVCFNRGKKHMDKLFRKTFLTRLSEYAKIADEHQRKAIW